MTLLVGQQEGHLHVKTEWWGAGVVICLERGAVLHMAQLMSLPLIVSCFSKIQTGYTFLVPDHPGSPRKRVIERAYVLDMRCAETDKTTEMPFRAWTWAESRNHFQVGAQISPGEGAILGAPP